MSETLQRGMQSTMEDFLRALRASDVRVTPAEAIDAHQAVDIVGYADRELFRDALCSTLAKTESEVARFDEVFDNFFKRETPPPPPPGGDPELARQALEDGEAGNDLHWIRHAFEAR